MRKRLYILILSFVFLVACCVFIGCNNGSGLSDDLPPFEYDYSEKYEDFGDGIVIDGKLDEEVYKSKRFLDEKVRNTTVRYKMTSVYGDKGIYFGFHIYDNAVFYNEAREIWANSGVEFIVASPNNLNLAYEIDLNVGGKKVLRRYSPGGTNPYKDFISQLHSKVWYNGALNTPECTEYSAEVFVPYNLLNDDYSQTPVDKVYVNPAIIRATSENPNDTNRLWYSIGEAERNLGWSPASETWYHFTNDGLVANEITLKATGSGKLEGKSYAITGDQYIVNIRPEKGNIIKSLKFNGVEVVDEISYKNGLAYYQGKVTENTEIVAEFALENSEVYTMSGKCFKSKDGSSEAVGVSAEIVATGNGQTYKATADEKGSYTIKLPKGNYTVTCSKEGSLDIIAKVEITADLAKDFTFEKQYPLEDNPDWDLSELANGTVTSLNGAWYVTNAHTYIMSDVIYTYANIVLPIQPGADRRAGFVFRTEDRDAFVCICANGESGNDRYQVQIIGNAGDSYWNGVDVLPGADKIYEQANSEEGVPFAAMYKDGKVSVWINGAQVYDNFDAIPYAKEARTGIRTCGGGTFKHLSFEDSAVAGNPIVIDVVGGGSVDCENQTFVPGSVVKFNVVPKDGFEVKSIYVNGEDYLAKVRNDMFEYSTGSVGSLYVKCIFKPAVVGDANVKGTLKDDQGALLEGVDIKLINKRTAKEYVATSTTDGAFNFTSTIPFGDYFVEVKKEKYNDYNESLRIDGDQNLEIVIKLTTLKDKYVIFMENEFDISKIEQGEITYIDSASEGHLNLKNYVKENENFKVEATFRHQEGFSSSDLRYGFDFFAHKNLHLDIIIYQGSVELQITDWNLWSAGALTTEEITAWKSETGLKVGAKRIGGVISMYTVMDGVEREVARAEHSEYATVAGTVGFGVWNSAPNAKITDIAFSLITLEDLYVINMENKFDISKIASGEIAYIDTAPEGHLNLKNYVKENEDFAVEATIYNQEGFSTTNLRYGFDFFADSVLHLDIIINDKGNYELQITDWGIWFGGALNEDEVNAWKSESGLKIGAKRTSGAISMYTVLNGVEREVCRAEGTKYANLPMTVGFGVWDSAPNAKFTDINFRIINLREKYVIDMENNFDISKIEQGEISYADEASEGHLNLKNYVKADENFKIEATIYNQEGFSATDLRYGFDFFADSVLHLDIIANGKGGYELQITDWGIWFGGALNEDEVNAWKSESGLKIGAKRTSGAISMYTILNGVEREVCRAEGTKYATLPMTVGFGVWNSAPNAKFTHIAFEIIVVKDYIISMENSFDVSKLNEGTLIYNDPNATEGHINLNNEVGADDNFKIEAVIHNQEGFSTTDLRYGFEFFGTSRLHLDFVTMEGSYGLQITDWSLWAGNVLSKEEINAWKSADGLKIGVKRINGAIIMYTVLNGTEREIIRTEANQYSNMAGTVGFGVWNGAKNGKITNITFEILAK